MELLQAIITRKSTRRYSGTVPHEKIEQLIMQASFAPSACNLRGWKCILVERRDDLDWLYRRGGSSVFAESVQVLLVCYEAQTENREWEDNIQSAAAYIAYFQLLAHDSGIGSCWICHLPPKKEVSRYFDIPLAYTPVAAVTFGLYREDNSFNKKNDRLPVHLSIERWYFDVSSELKPSKLRELLRRLYYALPFRHWLRGWAGRYEKKFDD